MPLVLGATAYGSKLLEERTTFGRWLTGVCIYTCMCACVLGGAGYACVCVLVCVCHACGREING